MKNIITFTKSNYDRLRKHLLKGIKADEEAAILLAGINETKEKIEILVKEIHEVPDSYLLTKGKAGLTIDPDFLSIYIKRCKHENLSFVLTHSHPFSKDSVQFSHIDDYGEAQLFPKVQKRAPNCNHATMVFGQNGIRARIWLRGNDHSSKVDEIKIVSDRLEKIGFTNGSSSKMDYQAEIYSRQVLAFTKKGQEKLETINVGIVGLGGIGSQVFQQLVHLGVNSFALIDDDIIEKSNLPRIVGSTQEDVKKDIPSNFHTAPE